MRVSRSLALVLLVPLLGLSQAQGQKAPVHWRMEPPLPEGKDFALTADYGEGTVYYLDRDYVFVGFQEPLAGGLLLRTYNDMKLETLVAAEDRDRWMCHVWVDTPMVVYMLWDRRTIHRVPMWLWNGNWQLTPLRQYTTDSSMDFFVVLRKIVTPGDTLVLGHPMAEGVPTPSMYVVIFKPIAGGRRGVPYSYQLGPAYPNPCASEVRLPYDLLDRSWVTVRVWDARGRLVAKILDEVREPGRYLLRWDLRNLDGLPLPSGIYFLHLRAGPFWEGSTRIVIVR